MPFHSGRVTFARFLVTGDAPKQADQALIDKLAQHAFAETSIGKAGDIEAGWVAGEHLLDTEFTYEKNAYGSMLLFALRMDTHKVPSDLKHAYRRIHEQALAGQNPSGFASRNQKKQAREEADRQLHDELAAGKYRRSKQIPLLWDLQTQQLYAGAVGNAVAEELSRRFRETFGCDLSLLTSGVMAAEILREDGRTRDFEDLRPSPFTVPPRAARAGDDSDADAPAPRDIAIPSAPWAQGSVDLKDFLGNEFLLWLWWVTENEEGAVEIDMPHGKRELALVLDRTLDMDCAWGAGGKQSLRGDAVTHMTEAGEALRCGKWPRKAGVILADGGMQWEFTLQADRWIVSSAQVPAVEDAESPRQLIEERLRAVHTLAAHLDAMYQRFLKLRVGKSWTTQREAISAWISKRRK